MSGGYKGKASLAVKEAMWKAWESKSPPVEWWRLGGLFRPGLACGQAAGSSKN